MVELQFQQLQIETWTEFQQSIIDETNEQWRITDSIVVFIGGDPSGVLVSRNPRLDEAVSRHSTLENLTKLSVILIELLLICIQCLFRISVVTQISD